MVDESSTPGSEDLDEQLDVRGLIRGLVRVGQALGEVTTLDDRLATLCEETAAMLRCDRSSIMLWDGVAYRARYNWGNPPDIAEMFHRYRVPLDAPLIQQMLATRTYVLVNDAPGHEALASVAATARIRSLVMAPLFAPAGDCLGFMTAEFNEHLGRFDGARADLVLGMAKLGQAAILGDRDQNARVAAENARNRVVQELVAAEDHERRRIARDIHDDSLQHAIALFVDIQTTAATADDPAMKATLNEFAARSQGVAEQLRGLVHEVHPLTLERADLVGAIRATVEPIALRCGWAHDVRDQMSEEPPPTTRAVLFRIVQQALHNAAQHAGATSLAVDLASDVSGFTAIVSDDGRGFDPDGVPADRFGLVSMRERAEYLGGSCKIETSDTGTIVRAWVPTSG